MKDATLWAFLKDRAFRGDRIARAWRWGSRGEGPAAAVSVRAVFPRRAVFQSATMMMNYSCEPPPSAVLKSQGPEIWSRGPWETRPPLGAYKLALSKKTVE